MKSRNKFNYKLYIVNYKLSSKGQAMVEYIFFTLIMLAASYGMLKLFIAAWKNKFEFISFITGIANAFF